MQSTSRRFGYSLAFAWAVATGSHALASDYPTTVGADNPRAYFRMNDSLARGNTNLNVGSLGAAASATNLNVRTSPGAIVGDRDRSQFYDSTARAIVPFQPALNPAADQPFTIEAWIYPASDQIGNGQAVIANRYVNTGESRQGWIIFQRAPNSTYSGKPGYEGVGWNFRMYSGSGGTTGLDIVSDSPYQVGSWVYLAVTYLPQTDTNTQGLIIYTNGVEAKRTFWGGSGPAYQPNTADHAGNPNGPAGLGFGSYNNTQPGSNPMFGAVDEFAFYTNALAPEKILAHYQNGTNAARTISYSALVQSDQPLEYLRFNEMPPRDNSVINIGEMRNTGYFTNYNVQWAADSTLPESSDRSFAYHLGSVSHTSLAYQDKLNAPEDVPMSIEFWVKADDDRINPGPAVINNRYTLGSNRTGWVIYQRAPNSTYSGQGGYEGVGYNLRMYSGSGSTSIDSKTSVPYKVGEWQHIVFNWLPDINFGGGYGTLSCYVNGQEAGSFIDGQPIPFETTGYYKANTNPSETGPSADFTVGSYNGIGNFVQTFMGQIDEVAIYTNYVLTADQVLAHYQAGTNAHPATNYSSLVLSAPYNGAYDGFLQGLNNSPNERYGPVAYLRFNDPAPFPAANSGILGAAADGAFQGAADNTVSGPRPPQYPGFEPTNLAGGFDGSLGWLGFNNPSGLNFAGQITVEALIRPAATQGSVARIISHGPEYVSLSPAVVDPGAPLTSPEVFLKIDGGNYVVGSSDGTTTFSASAPIPAGDLGTTAGVYLAGTYDGANWRLYRNGIQIASAAAATGSVIVTNGDWAIGSAGNGWTDLFSGKIDEVAIYSTALSASQIQSHYVSSTASPISLSVSIVNGRPQITYSGGILKGATAVDGAFTTVTGATSPYTPPLGPTMMFYRVSSQ